MDDNMEQQVRELERRLQRLEQQLSDNHKENERRRRQEAWTRIGLLILVGGAYVWYLARVTNIL